MFNFSKNGIEFDFAFSPVNPEDFLVNKKLETENSAETFKPQTINLPLCRSRQDRMHLDCEPGSKVKRYQSLASPDDEGCAVFSPFDAEFEGITKLRLPKLGKVPCAVLRTIETEISKTKHSTPENMSPSDVIKAAKNAAVIDEYDGSFLYQKLTVAAEQGADIAVINAYDDEPFGALGASLIKYLFNEVEEGARLAQHAIAGKEYVIAVNSFAVRKIKLDSSVNLLYAGTKYPAKAFISKALGKGKKSVIIGAGAAFHLYRAVCLNIPQTTQILNISDGRRTRIVEAVLGSEVSELLHFAGIKGEVLTSGLMSGEEVPEGSLVSGNMRDFVFAGAEERYITGCIGCGACNGVCTEKLKPSYIIRELEQGNFDNAYKLGLNKCIGCGACSYVCPCGLPVSSNLLIAKAMTEKSD